MKRLIKRILLAIALIPALLVLLVVTPFIVSPILNNITLSSFSKQIYNYPLPENMELIEKKAVCGKLNGNGNGMDYFACILIKTDMTIDQIKQYYKDKEFKSAKKDKEHVVNVEVSEICCGFYYSSTFVPHFGHM